MDTKPFAVDDSEQCRACGADFRGETGEYVVCNQPCPNEDCPSNQEDADKFQH